MPNTYTVELRQGHGASASAVVTKHVRAEDRYEAVLLARQLLALQNPEVDPTTIDAWCVTRHPGISA